MTILLLRLSNIRDTAASSTHRLLADLVCSALPDARVDFAFLPPKQAPRVSGVVSGTAWSEFDLILVSNSFVQEAVNLPWLLRANGVAAWAAERPEAFPPVILGGSNAFASQCLARPDGQAVPDAIFFGEAELSLPRFLRRWAAAPCGKRERLTQAAAGLDGFWVTGALPAAPVTQAVARTPPPPPAALPVLDVETAGTVRLTVASGCAAFCSFCFEGYERKPYREHAAADILGHARRLKAACGARAVELDAFNLNMYAGLGELVGPCARLFDRVSFKSQRADGIAACPAIIDLERAAGKQSFTLGIEGISARMRAFLSKSLSDADLAAALKALLERRVRELKLFFILTAYETPEDLDAFSDLCLRLKSWLGRPNTGPRVVLSFGRLVRMPNTPLAHDRLFLDEAEWRFAVDGVAAACRRAQLECRFATEWPDYLGTQRLAACGHESAEAVVALAEAGLSYHGPWRLPDALRLCAALPSVAQAAVGAFPFVSRTVSSSFLKDRWEMAQRFLDGGYCLGEACLGCAACASAEERQALTERARTASVTEAAVEAVARIEADKRRLAPCYLRVTLPDACCGHSPEWVSAHLMQRLLAQFPELTENLLVVEEALFAAGGNGEKLPVPAGETVLALKAWDASALVQRLTTCGRLGLNLRTLEPDTAAFKPGQFARAVWQVRTAAAPREAAQRASEWLKGQNLPHTLCRLGEGWRLEFAPAAAKKKCVFSLAVEGEAGGSRMEIAFSPKADLRALLVRLPPRDGAPLCVCAGFHR